MDVAALLNDPAAQAALFPFAVALVLGLALAPLGRWRTGLALAAGFAVTLLLAAGLTLPPRTSTHRIALAAAVSVPTGLLLELLPGAARRYAGATLGALLVAGALLWTIWPVAARREGVDYWLLVAGCSAYGVSLLLLLGSLADRPARLLDAAVVLGLATGTAAILGASALLGQLGLALGAAAGALALLHLISGAQSGGWPVALPVATVAALLGCAATVYSRLPWYALPLLAAVPLLAHLPRPITDSRWQMVASGLLALIPAVLAVALTWQAAGSAGAYG